MVAFSLGALILPMVFVIAWINPHTPGWIIYPTLILACCFLLLSAAVSPLPYLVRPLVFVGGVALLIVEFIVIGVIGIMTSGLSGIQ